MLAYFHYAFPIAGIDAVSKLFLIMKEVIAFGTFSVKKNCNAIDGLCLNDLTLHVDRADVIRGEGLNRNPGVLEIALKVKNLLI